jgi:hypothetical protein
MKKIISLLLLSLSSAAFAGNCNEKSLWGGWESSKNNMFETIAFESQENSKTFNYWIKGENENKIGLWSLDNCELKVTDENKKELYLFLVKIENSKNIKLTNKENNKVFVFKKMRD